MGARRSLTGGTGGPAVTLSRMRGTGAEVAAELDSSGRADPRWEAERSSWVPWVCAAVLVVAWATAVSGVTQPLVYADEAGYILNARHLAGLGDPSGTFYYPGYSLLLVPALWSSSEFDVAWRVIQLTNLGLLLGAFTILRSLLSQLAPWGSETRRTVVACVACLYPAWINNSSLAMSENLLLPAVLGAWWLLVRCEADPKPRAAWPVGLAAGAVTAVHPRAGVVLIAVVLAVAGAALTRRWSAITAGAAGAGAIAGVVVARVLVSISKITSDNTGSVIDNLTSVDGLRNVAVTLTGHLLYVLVATGGLAAVGFALLLRPRANHPITRGAVVLSLLGSWVLSAAFMAGGTGDKLIYGRYNEPFIAIVLGVGLAWVSAKGLRVRGAAAIAGSIVLLAGAFAKQTDHLDVSASVNQTNVFALLPLLRRSVPSVDWRMILMVGVVAVGTIVLLGVARRTRVLIPVVVGAVFVWTFTQNSRVLSADAEARALQGSLVDAIIEMNDGVPACVTLDRRELSQWHRYNYRVLLPRTRFDQVLALDERSLEGCGPFVLSSVNDVSSDVPGARLAALEAHAGVALWVLPGDRQASLAAEGRLLPPGWPAPLPSESLAASIELRGPGPSTHALRGGASIRVRVAHVGSGSPWVGATGLPGWDASPVRLVTTVVADDGSVVVGPLRTDVPATVMPGRSFEIVVDLPPVELQSAGHIDIELVAEGQGWFGENGRLRVPVDERSSADS